MGIPNSTRALFLAAAGQATGYQIPRSLRFNSADSAYLSKTFASAGNRKTWTWAGWVKRSSFDVTNNLFAVYPGSDFGNIRFVNQNIDFAEYSGGSYSGRKVTTAVFRDPSAWYHIVATWDTTNATAVDRMRLYVNGVRIDQFSTSTDPGPSADSVINTAITHRIGTFEGSTEFLNALLADVHFIDGGTPSTAVDSTGSVTGIPGAEYLLDFGEFDATTGVWNPKAYTGSYNVGVGAVNGFHLPFSDNSTAAALGTDTSGNGNDWTVNNISVLNGNGPYATQAGITTPSGGAIVNMYDGTLSTNALYGATTVRIFAGPSVTASSTLEIAWSTGSAPTVSVNGGAGIITPNGGGAAAYYTVPGFTGTINTIDVTFGNPANVFGIRVDGQILLDFSIGAGNDSLVDTPTSYGTDDPAGATARGNYCTLNPLDNGGLTLSNGNLDFTRSTTSWVSTRSTFGVSSGKWYWEVTLSTGNDCMAGVSKNDAALSSYFANVATGWAYNAQNGQKYNNGSGSAYGNSWVGGNDVVGVAFDADAGSIYFYKNGVVQNSGTAAFTGLTNGPYFPSVALYGTSTAFINFGQRPFAYQTAGTNRPSSDYKALCTTNLPAPVVAKSASAFDVKLYTGTGSNQSITGLEFAPDFVWIKTRNEAENHFLVDSVRGVTKQLYANLTDAEYTNANRFISFDSTGFTVGTTDDTNQLNNSFVAWTWDAGSSTVPNEDGSITSTVRANASAGFSIVTYTGNGTTDLASATIGHGLGVAPSLVITKNRSGAANTWNTYHASIGNTGALLLNSTAATDTNQRFWNNTSPTSTVFSVSTNSTGYTNANGINYVAYCFAPVAGYSSFGSYVGNGSASSGPFVYTGFRPRFLLVKNSNNTDGWSMWDAARDPYNEVIYKIEPNSSGAEGSNAVHKFDFLSNGFRVRGDWAGINGSGNTIIFACFAESPFQYARAR